MSVLVRYGQITPFSRGDGVETRLMIGKDIAKTAPFTTGTTIFPPGCGAPMHTHNCDEQVTILEGEAEASIGGTLHHLREGDTAFAAEGEPHFFRNISDKRLIILWVYGGREITRTFVETGETVPHLSAGDKV